MPEISREYVAIGVSQTETRHAVRTHHAVTPTAFWNQLAREFPKLREQVDTMLSQRLESGRLSERREYRWLVGTGGQYVEHGYESRLGPYRAALDPSLERGQVMLVAIEWALDP